jgi:hypothetical protein
MDVFNYFGDEELNEKIPENLKPMTDFDTADEVEEDSDEE